MEEECFGSPQSSVCYPTSLPPPPPPPPQPQYIATHIESGCVSWQLGHQLASSVSSPSIMISPGYIWDNKYFSTLSMSIMGRFGKFFGPLIAEGIVAPLISVRHS